jgi:hypothetical protein
VWANAGVEARMGAVGVNARVEAWVSVGAEPQSEAKLPSLAVDQGVCLRDNVNVRRA